MYMCILIKMCTLSNGMVPQVQCMYMHACIYTHICIHKHVHTSNGVAPPVNCPSETSVGSERRWWSSWGARVKRRESDCYFKDVRIFAYGLAG